MTINYNKLLDICNVRNEVQLYIEQGILPETFLQAIIRNDLLESSILMPSGIDAYDIFNIVNFFYNEAPFICWGSDKRMKEWVKKGGLLGRPKIQSHSSPIDHD
ncbi:MAG: hypothetical protein ABID54_05105 [Pseudomonadota bacterium]